MKTRSWIGMMTVLSLALVAPAAEAPNQLPGTPAPPPAPALEPPPAPALETPTPAQETPSPLVVPETPPPPTRTSPAAALPRVAPETTVPMTGQAAIKEDRTNLRSRPVLNSEVVAQLNKGDQVEVIEQINVNSPKPGEPAHWVKISLPKTNFVWVNSKFIDPATRTVSAPRLNARSGPGENHDVLGRLDKGTSIREVEVKGEWLKIQAPSGSYAFVASFLLDRGREIAGGTNPSPPSAAPPPTATPAALEPAGGVTAVAPPTVQTEEIVPEPEAKQPQLVKRIVSREGIVRRTISIQAPTEFALENSETRKMVNYLYNSPSSDIILRNFEGQRILVTGEELLDERWPNTPVINIEKLKARP